MPETRKLGRKTAHKNLMLRGMVTYLIENGKIETTYQRAKEVSRMAERMVTIAKKNTLAARRQAMAYITKESAVNTLFTKIAPEYEKTNGGYTAVYKLGKRRGDGAEMALIQFVKDEKKEESKPEAKKTGRRKSSAKTAATKSETAKTTAKTAKAAAAKAEEKVEEVKENVEKAEEAVEEAVETVEDAAKETAEKVEEAVEEASEKTAE